MPRVTKPEDLAANGGSPVNTKPWRTGKFHFPQEITALRKVLSGPALPLAGGDAVTAFRRQVQEAYGVKHAIPVSSGTTAIHVALHAAGVGAGDEVIVSPLTDYGSIIGKLLVRRPTHGQFMKTLAIAGVIGIATGLALHPVVPIIKRMFTSSYTLFTCGLISFIFLMFYWLIDVKGHKKWFFFFIVFGVNSIFVYMLNGLFRQWLVRTAGIFINPSEVVFGAWIHPAKECIRILIEWLICWWLLSKRIFMKI